MRPVLKSGLSRTWRDQETLRFGTLPDRAQLVGRADERFRAFLALLDGERDAAAVATAAGELGLDRECVEQTLGSLAESGLLEDAGAVERALAALPAGRRELLEPDLASLSLLHTGPGQGAGALARRVGRRIEVRGAGRVGAALASTLAAAGVGTVEVVDQGRVAARDCAPGGLAVQEIGRSRATAAREAVARAAGPGTAGREAGGPDLVVFAPRDGSGAYAGSADAARELMRAGVPHLYVGVVEHLGVVGPLVLPGASACGGCFGLSRTEQDAGWPRLLAQLAGEGPGRAREPACDGALAATVAGLAALHALLLLDGERPPSVDGWCEVSAVDGMVRRLRLTPHLECGCFWG
ncbi:ThiF family adenylyltransferase [Kitasatospora viridis]|uniref:Molybdopterin/thiamine biosynthesis adenylyltransferase n=1 Tax=Kitasatospora viridis TaxID=281105 RepID=A0A561UFB7_9ACTN|nr:ThiF family adenylyltransferase [Kitasatospora viridis]TWF98035.1 molybdopterin/thiamine biosynthesis adenylyltransferase [Kitasatospora viridis]